MATTSILCDIIQGDLSWCEGDVNLSGMTPEVYYTAKQNIASWPTYFESTGDPSKFPTGTMSGDFEMKAGKVFNRISIDPNKSQFTYESQGEYPNVSILNKLNLVHPGFGVQANAAATYINNHDCVFIFRDMNGRYRVCGSRKWVGKNTVSGDGGQGPTGSVNTTISVEQTDFTAAPFLQGSFPTADGEITATVESNFDA